MLVVGVSLLVWPLFDASLFSFRLCAAFGLAVSAETVRVTFLALRARREGAYLVLGGMMLFGAVVIYNAMRIFQWVPEQAFSTHTINFGILTAALGMFFFGAQLRPTAKNLRSSSSRSRNFHGRTSPTNAPSKP